MVEINILPTQEVVRRPRGDMLFFSFYLLSESKKKKKIVTDKSDQRYFKCIYLLLGQVNMFWLVARQQNNST